jgi:hypothetical protein
MVVEPLLLLAAAIHVLLRKARVRFCGIVPALVDDLELGRIFIAEARKCICVCSKYRA